MNEIGSLVAGSPGGDRGRHRPAHADDPDRHHDHERHAASTPTTGAFHVELLDNKFLTAGDRRRGADERDQLLPARPRRRHRARRVDGAASRAREPIQFVDYLYANDGASSVMGAVRGLRVLVPLHAQPVRAGARSSASTSRSTSSSRRTTATSRRSRCRPASSIPGQRNTVAGPDEHVRRQGHRRGRPGRRAGIARRRASSSSRSPPATRAKLDAAPPVDLPSLIARVPQAAARQRVGGDAVSGRRRRRARRQARARPARERARQAPPAEPHAARAGRTSRSRARVSPAKRVVNGQRTMLVRVARRRIAGGPS